MAGQLLAAVAPSHFPFMADEALEGAGFPRDYSLKTYAAFAQALAAKARDLGPGWTAEGVGRALWATAMVAAHGAPTEDKRAPKRGQSNEAAAKAPASKRSKKKAAGP